MTASPRLASSASSPRPDASHHAAGPVITGPAVFYTRPGGSAVRSFPDVTAGCLSLDSPWLWCCCAGIYVGQIPS